MIEIQKGSEKRNFLFDAGLIDEKKYCSWGMGKKVKVYFDSSINNHMKLAVKIVCLN
jgi:hypothetical protein